MKRPGGLAFVLAAVLATGALLRLAGFLVVRPLWIDEAMLALGIGRLSFAGLTGPLPYDQSAPLLFLWSVKAVTLVAGMSEVALRLVPLVSGLAISWVVWRSAKPLVGAGAALIATALAAGSFPLIRYSAELKPYGVDALVTVVLVVLTLRVRAAPDRSAAWWQLLAGGLIGMAASYAAPFVLAGAWAALLLDGRVRRSVAASRPMVLLTLGWGAGFGLLFLWLYLPQSRNLYMQAYWSETFLNLHAPDFGERLYDVARTLTSALPALPGWVPVKVSLALLVIGLLLIGRRGGLPALAQTGGPFLAMGAGALVAHYPVATRLFLFLSPFVFMAFGALIAGLGRLVRLPDTAAALAGTVLVGAWALPGFLGPDRLPAYFADGRASALLVAGSAGTEPVYILPGGLPAWAYYTTDWRRPDVHRLDRFARLGRADGPGALNGLLPEADTTERSSLVVQRGSRQELVGMRTGTRYLELRGNIGTGADSAWARREVDRIVLAARPYAWLFGSQLSTPTRLAMLAELSRRGIQITRELDEGNAIALRIQVPEDRAP